METATPFLPVRQLSCKLELELAVHIFYDKFNESLNVSTKPFILAPPGGARHRRGCQPNRLILREWSTGKLPLSPSPKHTPLGVR